jgi:hypothetical protein
MNLIIKNPHNKVFSRIKFTWPRQVTICKLLIKIIFLFNLAHSSACFVVHARSALNFKTKPSQQVRNTQTECANPAGGP